MLAAPPGNRIIPQWPYATPPEFPLYSFVCVYRYKKERLDHPPQCIPCLDPILGGQHETVI